MAQIVYTLRGVKAYEWAKDHPDDPLYIEPVGAPDDGSSARGVKVDLEKKLRNLSVFDRFATK